MNIKKLSLLLAAAFALAMMVTPALADSGQIMIDTTDDGIPDLLITEIDWTTSFKDHSYDCENGVVDITVEWSWQHSDVDPGTLGDQFPAHPEFEGFNFKFGTPGDVDIYENGWSNLSETSDADYGSGSVDVEFGYVCETLKTAGPGVMGNAHFELVLHIDSDGDGVLNDFLSLGVNHHVKG